MKKTMLLTLFLWPLTSAAMESSIVVKEQNNFQLLCKDEPAKQDFFQLSQDVLKTKTGEFVSDYIHDEFNNRIHKYINIKNQDCRTAALKLDSVSLLYASEETKTLDSWLALNLVKYNFAYTAISSGRDKTMPLFHMYMIVVGEYIKEVRALNKNSADTGDSSADYALGELLENSISVAGIARDKETSDALETEVLENGTSAAKERDAANLSNRKTGGAIIKAWNIHLARIDSQIPLYQSELDKAFASIRPLHSNYIQVIEFLGQHDRMANARTWLENDYKEHWSGQRMSICDLPTVGPGPGGARFKKENAQWFDSYIRRYCN